MSLRNILVKDIQRLRKNISRRFALIKEKYGDSPALTSFEEADLDLSVKGKSVKQLQKLLRELKYYDSLKTSRIKGVKDYKKTFAVIELALDSTGNRDLKIKFFKLYQQFVEENHLLDKYKYEVMRLIEEMMIFDYGVEDEKIREAVEELFQDLYEQEQGYVSSKRKGVDIDYEDTRGIFK